jgi:hypothetical protein
MLKNPCEKSGCKYHFGNSCFPTLAAVKAWAKPNSPERLKGFAPSPGDDIYAFLCEALECSPDRADYPEELPHRFYLQERGGGDTGHWPHFGYEPEWDFPHSGPEQFAYRHIFERDATRALRLTILRRAIRPQLDAVRDNAVGNVHIHHNPPFAKLVTEWLALIGAPLEALDITHYIDDGWLLEDEDLELSWIAFHAHRSTLTAMTPEEHMAAHHGAKT